MATVYALGGDGGGGGSVGIRPTAEPDSLTVQSVDPVTFSAAKFTTNDKDPAGKGLTLVGADRTSATRGMVAFDNGRVTYHAESRFKGTDTFTYTVRDANGGTDIGTATVTVTPEGAGGGHTLTTAERHLDSNIPPLMRETCAPVRGQNREWPRAQAELICTPVGRTVRTVRWAQFATVPRIRHAWTALHLGLCPGISTYRWVYPPSRKTVGVVSCGVGPFDRRAHLAFTYDSRHYVAIAKGRAGVTMNQLTHWWANLNLET